MPHTHHQTRQTIIQLLSNMSNNREARVYLDRFSGVSADRFAVIKIGGAILEEALEATAGALALLHKVGLTPIVIHGAGPQLDLALREKSIPAEKVDGLRVTPPAVLDVAREVFLRQNIKLVEAVRAQGVDAHTLNSGVIEAAVLDKEKYGFVGIAEDIQLDLIRSVITSGAIPILTCLGVAPGGQLVNINGDAVVAALVHAIRPIKIIFLSGVGGLLDQAGEVINSINLTTDYDRLMREDWVHSGMRLKIAEIKALLDDLPTESSISITRPEALIRELFTHGGSGTNIRQGEAITVYDDLSSLDVARLCSLIEDSFGRALNRDWHQHPAIDRAIVSRHYRAAAVVTQLPVAGGIAYLDKYAVAEAARGEGLARSVWRQLCEEFPHFFLRSRTENNFSDFYKENCDGFIRRGYWTIFWKGECDITRLGLIAHYISELPESFIQDSPADAP